MEKIPMYNNGFYQVLALVYLMAGKKGEIRND